MLNIPEKTLTTEQREILTKFRETLASMCILDEELLNSDNFLLRALSMNKFKVDKATQQIIDYVTSRSKYDIDQLLNETFPKEFTEKFAIFMGGQDSKGRPIVVIPNVRSWNLKEVLAKGQEEMFIRYMMKCSFALEKIVLERDVDYGILVVDAADSFQTAFTNAMNKQSIELVVRLLREGQKAAPGILGKMFILDAPKIFSTLFETARAIVNFPSDVEFLSSSSSKRRSWLDVLKEIVTKFGASNSKFASCMDKSLSSLFAQI